MIYHEYQQYPKRAASMSPLVPTGQDIEGPFYKAGAPWREVLHQPASLKLYGQVLDQNGIGVEAKLDFWQADENGVYDNDGFNFRGRQTTTATRLLVGLYRLMTVIPGDYQIADDPPDFRCAHIHVKVTADGFEPLTTQLYFAGDKYNVTDHWFDSRRVIGADGRFDFVLQKS